MKNGLNALQAHIVALATEEVVRKVARLRKAVDKAARALDKVADEINELQKPSKGKAVVRRKPRKKMVVKRARKSKKKSGRKHAVRGMGVNKITPKSLKALRKKLGVNQEAFAKLIKVSVSSLRAWEQGRVKPRVDKLSKVMKRLV